MILPGIHNTARIHAYISLSWICTCLPFGRGLKDCEPSQVRYRFFLSWRAGVVPNKIEPVVRKPAVELILEHRAEYVSNRQAAVAIARQERFGVESLRRWVIQAEIDVRDRNGQTSE